MNSSDIGGDIFTSTAIAACCSLHQHTIDVAQIDRESIELQLAGVLDFTGLLQSLADAMIKGAYIVFRKTIINRQHGYVMLYLRELGQWRAAHALRRRVGGDEIRVFCLELLQLNKERVIFSIWDRRLI